MLVVAAIRHIVSELDCELRLPLISLSERERATIISLDILLVIAFVQLAKSSSSVGLSTTSLAIGIASHMVVSK